MDDGAILGEPRSGAGGETSAIADRAHATAPNSADPAHYDAFLSYARTDTEFVIARLRPALEERGHRVWVDTDITGGAKWRDRVRRGIEACTALIFVISPDSVVSAACRQELDDALALQKLIIPVVARHMPPEGMPPLLADLEWVLLRDQDEWATGMVRLDDALAADLQWRDQHTRLAGRAREWLDADRDSSYALRGADLRAAEDWLASQEGHRQAATREQAEYITVSRRAASRRVRTLLEVVVVGLLLAVGLAVFALVQRGRAVDQAHKAQSQDLALQADGTADPELANLLALAAVQLSPTIDARSAILSSTDTQVLGIPFTAGHAGVHSVAFSPSGRMLASADENGVVRLWDVATHRPLGAPLTTNGGGQVAFSPDGRTLADGDIGGQIHIWDVATHRQIGGPIGPFSASINAVAFSPDGRTLAAASDDGRIRLWDVRTHRQLGTLVAGGGIAWGVVFSPDGSVLASASDQGRIRLWDVRTHRELGAPLIVSDPGDNGNPQLRPAVWQTAFSPDGRTLASADNDGTIRLWDVSTHRQIGPPIFADKEAVQEVVFSPDGKTLVSGGDDHSVRFWSVATHQEIGPPLKQDTDLVESVAFSPSGRSVASASGDGRIWLWRAAPAREITPPLAGDTQSVTSVAFAPNGKLLASGSFDGAVRLWDLGTHREIGSPLFVSSTDGVYSVAGLMAERLRPAMATG